MAGQSNSLIVNLHIHLEISVVNRQGAYTQRQIEAGAIQ
jgi:hypothetical protein